MYNKALSQKNPGHVVMDKKRYLALDMYALTMNSNDVNHKPHYMRAMLTLLIGAAAATSRILILPSVFHDS